VGLGKDKFPVTSLGYFVGLSRKYLILARDRGSEDGGGDILYPFRYGKDGEEEIRDAYT